VWRSADIRKVLENVPGRYQLLHPHNIIFLFEAVLKVTFIPRWLAPCRIGGYYINSSVVFDTFKSPIVRVGSYFSPLILVRDPDMAKAMCTQTQFWVKPIANYALLDFFGKNIVTTEGTLWKKHRSQCNPAFGDQNMVIVSQIAIKKAKEYFSIWGETATIDADKTMVNYSLSIICETSFGIELHLDNRKIEFDTTKHVMSFQESFRGVLDNLQTRLAWPDFFFKIPPLKKIDLYFSETRKYLYELMEKQPNQKEVKKDILNLLLNSRDQETESKKLTDAEIVADIFMFLLAGHETMAHTLIFSLHLLATHPDVQEELHQCVIDAIGNSDPSYKDLPKLDFPLKVFKETLRLFPSACTIPKESVGVNKLGNYTIPPKTRVDIQVLKLQRDPRYWNAPENFDPHRWDENSGQLGSTTPHCFFAFSFGKRSCIGRKFAELEGTFFLAMLAQNYKVEYVPGSYQIKEDELGGIITLTPTKPVNFLLKKR